MEKNGREKKPRKNMNIFKKNNLFVIIYRMLLINPVKNVWMIVFKFCMKPNEINRQRVIEEKSGS